MLLTFRSTHLTHFRREKMYLPQPEVKPRSPLMTWTLRLLLIFVCIITFFFLSLNLLAGKTDAHKRGLEAALSELIKAPVNIGTLHELNIIPQFRFDIENTTFLGGGIERLNIAYGFWDLFLNRPYIEDITIQNLRIPAGVIGPFSLRVNRASITPASLFTLDGFIEDMPFSANVPLAKLPDRFRPSYRITAPKISLQAGSTKIDYAATNEKKSLAITSPSLTKTFLFSNSVFAVAPQALLMVLQAQDKSCAYLKIIAAPSYMEVSEIQQDEAENLLPPDKIKLTCSNAGSP
jgi:hypothetical protein